MHLVSALLKPPALTTPGLWPIITYVVFGCAMLCLGLLLLKSRKSDDHRSLKTLYGASG
ncbi:MAG: hypothetical protein VB088_14620 [Sphaerochaeta sp.]|nr:hypothetical protein [Sphaerochaeta sp.]